MHTHTPGMWCRKGEQHPTPVSGNRMMKEAFTSRKEATNTHKIIQTCHADAHRSTESHTHKLTAARLFCFFAVRMHTDTNETEKGLLLQNRQKHRCTVHCHKQTIRVHTHEHRTVFLW